MSIDTSCYVFGGQQPYKCDLCETDGLYAKDKEIIGVDNDLHGLVEGTADFVAPSVADRHICLECLRRIYSLLGGDNNGLPEGYALWEPQP